MSGFSYKLNEWIQQHLILQIRQKFIWDKTLLRAERPEHQQKGGAFQRKQSRENISLQARAFTTRGACTDKRQSTLQARAVLEGSLRNEMYRAITGSRLYWAGKPVKDDDNLYALTSSRAATGELVRSSDTTYVWEDPYDTAKTVGRFWTWNVPRMIFL